MQNNIFQQISMGHFYYDYLAPSLTFIGQLYYSLDNFLIRCDIKPCKTLEDKTSGFILELNTLGYTDLFVCFFFFHENWPKCSSIISGLKCFVFDISNTSFLRPSHVTKDRPTNIIIVLFNIYFLFNQKEYRRSLMHFLKSSSAYN